MVADVETNKLKADVSEEKTVSESNLVKQRLRKEYLSYRDELTEQERSERSKRIIAALQETGEYMRAERLLIYLNFRSEVLSIPLVKELLVDFGRKMGKKVYCPRVSGAEMDFYEVTALCQLSSGCWGILEPEPVAENRFTPRHYRQHSCLVIMPGAVFDLNRGRIGYGRGYYDRFLKEYSGISTAALAYECQIAPEVPTEDYDIKPDFIITENRIIR